MPDSGSLRTQRWKLHKAGDHSLCKHAPEARITLAQPPDLDPDGGLDALAELTALARRLAAAHVADPANAYVARELRATLLAVAEAEPPAEDPMDELRKMASRVS